MADAADMPKTAKPPKPQRAGERPATTAAAKPAKTAKSVGVEPPPKPATKPASKPSPRKAAPAKAESLAAKPALTAPAKAAKPKAKTSAKLAAAPPQESGPVPGPSRGPGPGSAPKLSASATAVPELSGVDPDQRAALEALSLNLAKAALTAQGAIAEAALAQADRPKALSPDPFNVAPAMTEVMGRLVGQPDRLFRAQADLFSRYMDLWQSAARRAAGETPEPVIEPAKGDKRFNDPEWTSNPVFDVMKQSYLLTSAWLNNLIGSVETTDPMTRRRAEFFTKLLTDAFSPTNFLASNPAALKELMATNGESLVRGMEQFAADMERGSGQLAISQTNYERFKVGENVATAPGQVIWRDELFELLQFDPSTETAHKIPLLIFPPWINKYYILDLRPENSMIRWLSAQGFTVFLTSWVNPDKSLANRDLDDYMRDGIYKAVGKVCEQAGVDRVNTVGYCIGGTMLGATLAHMAAKGDASIASATFFAAQHDFAEAGDLRLFTDERWLQALERQMDEAGGVLPGAAMADTFNALRANDLVWSFFVNNYLMGKAPAAFDLLYWNSDQTRMPKCLHMSYLRKMYGQNAFSRGELELGGVKLDPKAVKIPLYFQASREDHIAPARSVYRSARLFGGPVTLTLAGSGHIAGVVNPPAANKYQYWENAALPPTFEEWMDGAVEHPGSWWMHWAKWLSALSGELLPARDPAKGPLKPIEPAPGSYVKVKS